jgi:hypothetical protein
MTHSEFVNFIRSLLGKVPKPEAREMLAELNLSKGFEAFLRWEWMPKEVMKKLFEEVNGSVMDFGSFSDNGCRIFVHEDARK